MPNDKEIQKPFSLRNIQGVEIFSVGKWNGDEYSEADLDEMVRAFNDTQETSKPALKLGHDDDQKILQNDGFPAAGWVGRLYRQGQKLLADFIDIPEKIYQLIERKAYRNVSSEIYWEADVNGQKYGRMLAGVALLGADMPAVSNLSDMLAMYGMKINERKSYAEDKSVPTIKIYRYNGGGETMPTEDKKEVIVEDKEKEALAAAKVTELETQVKEYKASLESLKQSKEDAEKRIADLEKTSKDSLLDADLNVMVASGSMSPAMKPYAKELLGEDKKVYSLNKKELSKQEVLKEMLSLHSEALKLNKKETTIDGDKIPQVDSKLEELNKYAEENKCTHAEAFKALYHGKINKKTA